MNTVGPVTNSNAAEEYDFLDIKTQTYLRKKCANKYNNKGIINSFFDFINPFNHCLSYESKPKISPYIFKVIRYLIKEGTRTERIFDIPSNPYVTDGLCQLIKYNKEVDLSDFDIYTIANACKQYIREELDGLIPKDISVTLEKNIKKGNPLKDLEYLPFTLEHEKRILLIHLFTLFKKIDENSYFNGMTLKNIFICSAPSILPKIVQKNLRDFIPMTEILVNIYNLDFRYVPSKLIDN
ncbi:hypothetical protein H312_03525 [Anncaliia algerae PRA339]|uniref:Rho-GAP domain-containing protein n=1 Tax=Anncaliia algerae PRA339 TaxID=1288291 RepID=A0A059EW21_9MICR|nr:hypothetical protein H312_03525 [Anncaliia algerae PRA339]